MRWLTKHWIGAAVLAVVCAAPVAARADEQGGLKAENTQVSDKDKLSQAQSTVNRLHAILKDVLKSLEEARREKDVVKLNCVNEKLTQIKGLLRVAEQSQVALQEALARSDEDAAQHEFAKTSIAKQRAEQLRADAEQCIGQLAYVVDERTVVTVETPDDIPDATTNPTVLVATAVNPPAISRKLSFRSSTVS